MKKGNGMIRVVLDTNVIVSALLSPDGKPAFIVGMALNEIIRMHYTVSMIAEYEDVLSRPKFGNRIGERRRSRYFDDLMSFGVCVIPPPASRIKMSDESDRIFYDVATAYNAILISGNKKHFPEDGRILTPAQFIETIYH